MTQPANGVPVGEVVAELCGSQLGSLLWENATLKVQVRQLTAIASQAAAAAAHADDRECGDG